MDATVVPQPLADQLRAWVRVVETWDHPAIAKYSLGIGSRRILRVPGSAETVTVEWRTPQERYPRSSRDMRVQTRSEALQALAVDLGFAVNVDCHVVPPLFCKTVSFDMRNGSRMHAT